MRLLVFGAAGRTGRLVVSKALGHGHEVTALRPQANAGACNTSGCAWCEVTFATSHPSAAAVVGHSAIAFALSTSLGGTGVQEAGIANVIYAMAEKGVDRLSAVSCPARSSATARSSPLGVACWSPQPFVVPTTTSRRWSVGSWRRTSTGRSCARWACPTRQPPATTGSHSMGSPLSDGKGFACRRGLARGQVA